MDVLRVRLGDATLEARLREQAKRERRRPQDQAAYLLEQVLREAPSDELKKCEQAAVAAA